MILPLDEVKNYICMKKNEKKNAFKEMEVYMKNFSGNVESQVSSQNHLVRQDEPQTNKPQFKSCAYIQRLRKIYCRSNY